MPHWLRGRGEGRAWSGFFRFAGQGGYGIQTAPATARLGAALIRGGPVPGDLLARGLDASRLAPRRLGMSVAAGP